ncbi:MAG: PAS domain S-box protein [Clostridia bacterium]|nr:PAS domain S-box protein [Clostridia bacterium]
MTDDMHFPNSEEAVPDTSEADSFPLDRLFDLSLDMLSIGDTDGHLLRVNPAWSQVLGYTREELEGARFLDFVHPDDLPDTMEAIRRLVRQESVVSFVNRYRHKDGSWRSIEWRSRPEGNRIYAACRDVTDRIRRDRALQDSLERYRILFENAVEAISVIQNGVYVLCNPMAYRLTGYAEEDLGKVAALDIVHPYDRAAAAATLDNRYVEPGYAARSELRFVRKNGEVIWAEVGGVRIEWNGAPAILSFSTDITKRKEAEAALRTSEEKYRMLAEHASDVIWVFNVDRRQITYVSPSVETQRGFTVEEVMRQTITDAHDEDSVADILGTAQEEVADFIEHPDEPRTYVRQIRQTVKGGGYKWIENSIRYRRNELGEIEKIGVSRDIDERKLVEQKILELSFHDQLTGLYNRRFYEEELKRLNTRRNLPISLVIADVNGLKLVNDAFGHLAGDQLLIRVAGIIRSVSRADDIIARIGGDEFVMLLPKTDAAEAEIIVRRIRDAIARESAQPAVISVSFGWATRTGLDEEMENVFTEAENSMYRRKLTESNSMRSETIKIVTGTLYQKSPKEQAHSHRVGMLCGAIAQAMGMGPDDARDMITAGLMHDIGKIVFDDRLLDQTRKPMEEDWIEIRRHPEIGYQILRSSAEFTGIAAYVLSHHERPDGGGYPRGIRQPEIPTGSLILAVAEAFDEMTSARKYRRKLSEEAAVEEIRRGVGTQFDEVVARTFVTKVLNRAWTSGR